jgi:hypothetical protein
MITMAYIDNRYCLSNDYRGTTRFSNYIVNVSWLNTGLFSSIGSLTGDLVDALGEPLNITGCDTSD